MDEIDSLVPSRNSDDSGETESRVVAQLLTMMDGMGDTGQIVVVGATNRPNAIDSALRRPGRFDQEVEIGIPDVEAREEILQKLFARMNSEKCKLTKEEITKIAAKTHGYVGADLTALCRESVMKAINRGLTSNIPQNKIKVIEEDVDHALPEIRPSAMREVFLEMPKVYWTDIGGQHELKQKLMEVVQLPLEAISSPKGVLLYGPPGCSKTLTAKALATESGLNFLAVKGPEIFNKYVGESERTIREIFRKARAASPSIIFFDEIDAIAGDRDGDSTTTAASNVLTSLLNEIDGVEELKGVVIVGATNKPTEIDPALLRPGRLDRHIYVAPPDYEARLQILEKCTRKFNLDKNDVNLATFAELTDGCSGAEVTLLCQEAGLAAIMENKDASSVTKKHFDHALKGISKGITPEMLQYYETFSKKSGLNL
ncbi:AFG2 ATPase family gene 2 protein [Candida maltosa Xu316]